MNSYIVRIYRQEKDKPHSLVGIVEKVGGEGKKSSLLSARRQAFTNVDELWEILNATGQLPKKQKRIRSR